MMIVFCIIEYIKVKLFITINYLKLIIVLNKELRGIHVITMHF